MRLLLLCILGWLISAAVARAECNCLWQGSFVEVQAGADLVVSGTVARAKGNSIDLAVERTLRGSNDAEEIRIWLKTADYCRPEPELFPPGSEWVMALSRIVEDVPGGFNPNTPNVSYGRPGDYSLSSCGGYWLSRSGDWVSGNLVQAPRWVRDPKMTPVLIDLLVAFMDGRVDAEALAEASREDPAARELMLDTKAFLRETD
ncbi:MAG: delta-aminolevulinic acid dehydratase [Halioglobus sp.]|nr:delta-aminolevulinic acid dehydratase [Halioglobus sp.]